MIMNAKDLGKQNECSYTEMNTKHTEVGTY